MTEGETWSIREIVIAFFIGIVSFLIFFFLIPHLDFSPFFKSEERDGQNETSTFVLNENIDEGINKFKLE